MASKQSYELVDLFKRLRSAIAANQSMTMEERRAVMERLSGRRHRPAPRGGRCSLICPPWDDACSLPKAD